MIGARSAAVISTLLVLGGCAKSNSLGSAFNTDWLNDRGNSISEVERRLRQKPAPAVTNVVVGLSGTAIVGLPLDAGRRWAHTAKPDTLPSIAADLVVYSAGGKVAALDAKTGALRWQVDAGGFHLRGAGDDGQTTVLSLADAGGLRRSLLLAVDRTGSVRSRIATDKELGRPAARGGIAFVPWAGQYVSAIEMASGREVGRLLTRELTSHALAVGTELYFGEHSVTHFDERIQYASTSQGVRTALPSRVLPGRPRWLGPGGEVPAIDVGARSRIQIYAAPRWTGNETRFASDRFVATYFRAVMALDAANGQLSWARAVPSEVIGGAAAQSGFVFCTASGRALRIGAAGGAADALDLGTPLRACVVEASALIVPAGQSLGSLATQIGDTLRELDPEMAAAQAFLVTELGRIPDPVVTKTLIELTTSPRVPPDVRLRARDLLAARRSGAEFMLAALQQQYDFLSGALLPPPVGPLAQALTAMGEQRAAPLLARHLNDPSTDANDVEQAARALSKLATPEEAPSLKTFFALYRATADEPALIQAVIAVAQALLRVGGQEARAQVERAARDPLTQPEIARSLEPMVYRAQAAQAETATQR